MTVPAEPVAWPGGARCAASFSFDVDAESAMLAVDHGHADRMSAISHQAYGPLVGVPRILKILARHDVTSTFFVPGYTALRYPDVIRSIVAEGHEIAHHGYLHEAMAGLSVEQEAAILDRGLEVLERVTGSRPTGYRAPMWELNWHSPKLLHDRGFLYDSSLMDADHPYELVRWNRITGRDPDPVGARRLGAVLLRAGLFGDRPHRKPRQGRGDVAVGVRWTPRGGRVLRADQPPVPLGTAVTGRGAGGFDRTCVLPRRRVGVASRGDRRARARAGVDAAVGATAGPRRLLASQVSFVQMGGSRCGE